MRVIVSPLPQLVRDLPRDVEPSRPRESAAAPTIVTRTVILRADRQRLQEDLERELRALLGFGGRLGR
jgi:hypothetical protein